MNKQPVAINFSKGLDNKTDPYQVGAGLFLNLVNSVFDVIGRLTKRNGNGYLATLPNPASYITTFNGDLTAIGSTFQAYISGSKLWVNKGSMQPCSLSVLPLVKNSINQTQCDSAIADNGLICTVYTETNGSSSAYKYVIADSVTGQNVVQHTLIPGLTGTVTGSPRVFLLNNLFIIVFTNVISATSHLQYIAVSSINTSSVTTNQDIAANYVSATTVAWDGLVVNQNLYIAYNTTSGGQSVRVTYLSALQASTGAAPITPVTFATYKGTMFSVCADMTQSNVAIYVSFYRADTSLGYTVTLNVNLNTVHGPTQIIPFGAVANLATAAQNGVCTIFFESVNAYTFNAAIPANFIQAVTLTGTTVGTPYKVIRNVGLASKALIFNGVMYFLSTTVSTNGSGVTESYQPTYFLINGSTSIQTAPVIVSKLAYQNGGGYLRTGLPNYNLIGSSVYIPYLFKDLVTAVNKNTNVSSGSQVNGVYSQTGINLVDITIGSQGLDSAEIGSNLNVTGGFAWSYDGYSPVEQNFFLYPELDPSQDVGSGGGWATATTGGSLTAQVYFYQAVYEWSDNQGNAHKSATSVPIKCDISASMTSTNTITVNVPTIRQTYKINNPVKITLYRWSTAQQIYYQVTSVSAPKLNDLTVDFIAITDILSDASILGNENIYTNGGVVENTNAPATSLMALFDDRLWQVSSEDSNTLYFSKTVVQSDPVQMSNEFTYYAASGEASQGPTGPITAIAPMDDKLILFKANAIYYINGTGPNDLGTGSQYPNAPIFITATVGCSNQQSIVFTNNGLMFQSSKGIWLLSRGLSVEYIGAAVEKYNSINVNSAINVPGTNRVEFSLDSGATLIYDYFVGQWGTFSGAPAIASTIYQDLPTHINSGGVAFQETPDQYLDLGNPVLMSLQTGWISLAGLSGYQRAYYVYLLGTFISPHKLQVDLSYDFSPAPSQGVLITPRNYSLPFGGDPIYGDATPYGGPTSLEQWKIHIQRQTCQVIQISMQEIFDPSFGTVAGEGLTLTGFTCLAGFKKSGRPIGKQFSTG